MERKWRLRLLWVGWVLLLAAGAGVCSYFRQAYAAKELRGMLRQYIAVPESGSSGFVLITATGSYELELRRGAEWQQRLMTLEDKYVVVIGRLTVRLGNSGRPRRIIVVDVLKPDAPLGPSTSTPAASVLLSRSRNAGPGAESLERSFSTWRCSP